MLSLFYFYIYSINFFGEGEREPNPDETCHLLRAFSQWNFIFTTFLQELICRIDFPAIIFLPIITDQNWSSRRHVIRKQTCTYARPDNAI